MKRLHLVALLIGSSLFVYLMQQVGLGRIFHALGRMGSAFLLLLLISGFRHSLRAMAWLRCFEPNHAHISWSTLFAVRLAGEAVRFLSFLGPLLGEPVKIALMKKRLPLEERVSSVIIENLTYAMSAIVITLSGIVLFFTTAPSRNGLAHIGLGVALILVGAALLIGWVVACRCHPLARAMRALAERTGIGWVRGAANGVERVEESVSDFYSHRRSTLVLVFSLQLATHFTSMAEIYLILNALDVEASFLTAFTIEALIKIVNFAFFFVPAQVGVFEGGNALILEALELGVATGVVLALIEKVRTLAWAGCGLIALGWMLRRRTLAGVTEAIEGADLVPPPRVVPQ